MKKLKSTIIGLIAIVALIVVASFFTPKEVVVTRTIVVDAPPARLFPYMSHFQRFNTWSPWAGDPNIEFRIENRPGKLEHAMTWKSNLKEEGFDPYPSRKNGRQQVVELTQDKLLKSQLTFDGQVPSFSIFELKKELAYTRVTWSMKTDVGWNPIARYKGLLMEQWAGDDMERGLKKLKKVAEQK